MELFVGSTKYVRQANLLEEAGNYISYFGNKATLIGGQTALAVTGSKLSKALDEAGISFEKPLQFGGECTWNEVQDLIDAVQKQKPSVLVAIGGGKAIDTVKAVAYAAGLPLTAIPTIAATCAPATGLSVMYDDQGKYVESSLQSKAADLILVDSQVIAEAPVDFLIAGIGDTLAKWFESSAASKKQKPNIFYRSAVKIAHQLYEVLMESGIEATASVRFQRVTQALEEVIDSIILVSGSVSGYGGDKCRTAAAHAVYSGLTIFPETHQTYHGMIVAFGILAQLVMEGKPVEEVCDLIPLYREIGLPVTLREMGIEQLSPQDWTRLGETTAKIEDMKNMPFIVTHEKVIQSIQEADRIGRSAIQ